MEVDRIALKQSGSFHCVGHNIVLDADPNIDTFKTPGPLYVTIFGAS
jgi:hypothetical protein